MRVAVIGVGLIGGSIAAALKQRKPDTYIIGVGRSLDNLAIAQTRGLIDSIATSPNNLQANIAVVCTPPQSAIETLRILKNTDIELVTDAVSFKQSIANEASQPGWSGRLVPAHPIAGTENQGAVAAEPDLFVNRNVIITPVESNSADQILRCRDFWTLLGARTQLMTPEEHDNLYAWTSHAPHAYLYAFAQALFDRYPVATLREGSGGGLRDLLRITASTAEMWDGVFAGNREPVLAALSAIQQELSNIMHAIETGAPLHKQLEELRQKTRAYREVAPESIA